MATTFGLGDLTIHRIIEQEEPLLEARDFLPDLTAEMLAENASWMAPSAFDPATGKLVLCIQSYVIRTPHHTILVDSCVGNHKDRPARAFWHMQTGDRYMRALAAAGLTVEDIDYVMCTHLHVDHVGWNTKLVDGRWVPTFPNARYLFGDREFAYWKDMNEKQEIGCIADSVLPIVEAGKADLVTCDHGIGDHVTLEPTPGHTIDHRAVHIASAGRRGVITGDLIHSPIQARYPDLSTRVDYDKAQAAATRRRFLETHCDTDTLICTGHFPSPSVGHVKPWDDGFRFVPSSG
ncbi:glyoxylase-like metal-dependent hydrolase (beta-lactamase superfamily II) [Constrictibacter sp. MBR-5]|jgi:glyoxylase-like metal-dependent hydrolase (beta-lactamase superfamily II)|uniref:MBL fold metallo-hydrolase n=1 Tax=Constrictibacter sp. MBR-5 TaxID=3156467 RepID=UPI0033973D2A